MLDSLFADIAIYAFKLIVVASILVTALRHKER